MVQTASSRPCERAADNPERQAPRPLPILRTTVELPGNSAVLCESPAHLEGMAEPPDTGKAADLGTVCRNTTSAPAPTTSDHTHLGQGMNSTVSALSAISRSPGLQVALLLSRLSHDGWFTAPGIDSCFTRVP